MSQHMPSRAEPIAIVGSACRFPGGSSSPSALWSLLKEPRDLLKEIPASRFNPGGFYHPNGEHHGSTNVESSYLLDEDHRQFDNNFFNVNPREAAALDPQQRLLLETVYESIESAGFSIDSMQGSQTSVYVGSMTADYYDIQLRDVDTTPQYLATGTARSILSNRISYFFNWKGPSMTIDTACSSSLVAVHHAVQSLRAGESTVAIAAGVNLILGPEMYIFESKLHMLSPTGRSRMWDTRADGYARGEGFAALTLKTLNQAIKDGDHIECVIRETGVNQDGRTKGITMPSAESQTELIRSTYRKAGLDLERESDRCQYFEAHGTGTPAGDPTEAEAIKQAFFPDKDPSNKEGKLFVGSVKTVIGHLEGAAGLAGVLKASLALQNSTIPPNMHFNQLSPSVRPFYDNLQIITTSEKWPAVAHGSPRRASVNSFGFGGTNAHAILESWEPAAKSITRRESSSHDIPQSFGPFNFSANSEKALTSTIKNTSAFLREAESVDLNDLAWTLQTRRSNFPFRTSFSAVSKEDLASQIETLLQKSTATPGTEIGTRPILVTHDLPARIFGVFTGQGAQWATMGKHLILESKLFAATIDKLEDSLATLPDPPPWSLKEELLAAGSDSRLGEALLSQPLCTAVQIALVDLLRSANVQFDAVVGHSSGEIAAAYTSGIFSASDALRVAYYRGVHTKLALGPTGQTGAMLAVGISFKEALEFCERDMFAGRLSVAASNAPSSVTLSGDADAIEEAELHFDQRGTFVRKLKVDTAYHSQHMEPCSEPYVESLRQCGIQVQKPRSDCVWYSSVLGSDGNIQDMEYSLEDTYWAANMRSPVLFSQAMARAISDQGCFDIALEVGPHPALKGPSTQIFKQITGINIPYYGLLQRGENDAVAFSGTLGKLWTHFSAPYVDFDFYRIASQGQGFLKPQVLKSLPAYPWDHEQTFWKESRISKKYRTRTDSAHELLGTRATDDTEDDMRWRNIIQLNEIPWLKGHQFQGQTLFPAAGYVAMSVEASVSLSHGKGVRLVEIQDMVIHRPITLEENSPGVEVLFNLKRLSTTDETITGTFSCYAGKYDENSSPPEKIFTGRVLVTIGNTLSDALPSRVPPSLPMNDVELDSFYGSLSNIGLDYSGLFLVNSMKRRLGVATATVSRPQHTELFVHPAQLDAAFHAIFAAFCTPGDSRFWTHYLPTSISSVRVNPGLCQAMRGQEGLTIVDSYLGDANTKTITGDIEIFGADSGQMEIGVQGFTCSSFLNPKPADDRKLFSNTIWKADISSGTTREDADIPDSKEDMEIIDRCERACYYYLRNLRAVVKQEEICTFEWYFQSFFEMIDDLLFNISEGNHPTIKKGWVDDTHDMILSWGEAHKGQIDLEIIIAVGENLPSIVRGETPILQIMMENDMLNRLYKFGLGFKYANNILALAASQISHRYPRMKILEIGAGTGGASWKVLEALGASFSSYTYTDISAGFFEKARDLFSEFSSRMVFKTLDIEKNPVDQGYVEGSYDMIIASNVLHATRILKNTMGNVRRLLKPGGYLLLLEVTSDVLRPRFVMSGLPGWWLGQDDGRKFHPTLNPNEWNKVLRDTGFSGVDSVSNDFHHKTKYLTSIMVSQATDSRVQLLRRPTLFLDLIPRVNQFAIIGGSTLPVARLVEDLTELLQSWNSDPVLVNTIAEIDRGTLFPGSTVICLSELDEPFFKSISEASLRGMQSIFSQAKNVLWITHGAKSDNPYSNMLLGVARSVLLESPHVRLQFLDVETSEKDRLDSHILATALLRLVAMDSVGIMDNLLWTTEHELILERQKTLIPRIIPNKKLNDRLNSEKRVIMRDVSLNDSSIVINPSSSSISEGFKNSTTHTEEAGKARVGVRFSTFLPIRTLENENRFLCVGSQTGSNVPVVVLSHENSSLVDIDSHMMVPCPLAPGAEDSYLELLLNTVLAKSILKLKISDGSIWIHEPEPSFAKAITLQASANNFDVIITSESTVTNWTHIHPYASHRSIKSIHPANVSLFADMCQDNLKTLATRILSTLPESCRTYKVAPHSSKYLSLDFSLAGLQECLINGCARLSLVENSLPSRSQNRIELGELSPSTKATTLYSYSAIVDWAHQTTVQIRVKPIDPKTLFKSDKTYFLVGLTGELGQSICDWMVRNGARHLVVTSRNPNINSEWIKQLQRVGGIIKVFAMDVTDKAALRSVHQTICDNMPPIAGVSNAAMVLRDKAFSEMTLDEMIDVLRPKVEGTKNLDEIFGNSKLDFFILFSSLACVIGNRGQSNYGAANMFMTSFVNQRRKRGLAASIIDIGMLLGVGYVARTGASTMSRLRTYNYMAIAETEMHEIFAEAIAAGDPSSGEIPEIITSLQSTSMSVSEEVRPPWYQDPRFSHYIVEQEAARNDTGTKAAILSVEKQLLDAKNGEEAVIILENCFAAKLELILQIPSDNVDKGIPLADLGIDSLIAVEIRSWFLKELMIDMPVLKVLGGSSITDLCKDAMSRLPDSVKLRKGDPLPTKETSSSSDDSGSISSRNSSDETATTPAESEVSASQPTGKQVGSQRLFYRKGEMSYAESRLWFLHLYLQDVSTCNVTFAGEVKGLLQAAQLQSALQAVSQRHSILRTSFFQDAETSQPMKGVASSSFIQFEHKKIANDHDIESEMERVKKHAFDLENGKTLIVLLLSRSSDSHHIIVGYHHMIMDGVSWLIFLQDLNSAYSGKILSPLNHDHLDFSINQRKAIQNGELKTEIDFWKEEFPDVPGPLKLFPFSRVESRCTMTEYDTHTFDINIDADLMAQIKKTSTGLRITPFHFYLSAIQFLLQPFLEGNDLVIGIMDANRNEENSLDIMGFFLNLLPLRFKLDDEQSFADVARSTRKKVFSALGHSRLPFDILLDELNVPRSSEHSPLFQVAMNYRMGYSYHTPIGTSGIKWVSSAPARNPYDLVVDVTETEGSCLVSFTTQRYLYMGEDVQKLMQSYVSLLKVLAEDTSICLQNTLQTEVETQLSSARGHGQRVDFALWPATLSHRIDQITESYGERIAVKDTLGSSLSYCQVAARAHDIASSLIGLHLPAEFRVAVYLEPSTDSACSLLAIMRAGAIYVPLDPRNPVSRLAVMVEDCRPAVIICDDNTSGQVQHLNTLDVPVLNISTISPKGDYAPNLALRHGAAFALYTSGSTGIPKGILLSHSGLLNQIAGIQQVFGIGQERVLQQSSLGFDMSLEQIFIALCNGGTVVVVSKEHRGDPAAIARIMREESITYTEFVPSEYSILLRYGANDLRQCHSWKFAFSGGEEVTPKLKSAFAGLDLPHLRLLNVYGPTEVSVSCTRGEIAYREAEITVPSFGSVGYVMPNYSVYILDERLEHVPAGFPGQICVGGKGVGIGYLNNEVLTQERFIKNKFTTANSDQHQSSLLYLTGDRGRLLDDGSLIFQGRMDGDSQIKLRGIRIEPDEISSVILRTGASEIADVAISARGDPVFLVAFIVFAQRSQPVDQQLYLKNLRASLPLPPYMLPTLMVPVDKIPMNVNGKRDKFAIAQIPLPKLVKDEQTETLGGIALQLKDVWIDVLSETEDLFEIDHDSDFFSVGGSSLLLIKLQSHIKESFGINIPLAELFQASSLQSMASRIELPLRPQNSDSIDWAQETVFSEAGLIHPQIRTNGAIRTSSGRSILLTGATGFLGKSLLQQLVADPSVSKIHCIAVRNDREGRTRQLPIESAKVQLYPGDLSAPLFGLSSHKFNHLGETVDAIIHNGADVSFLKMYQSFRGTNFESTKQLLGLALPRNIPVHFVSSASVAHFSMLSPLPEISVTDFFPPVNGTNGYASAKWASERYLENAAVVNPNLEVFIHRPTSITGIDAPAMDVVANLLKYSLRLRCVPILQGVRGAFDFIPVEKVVSGVLATLGEHPSRERVRYVHHCSDEKVLPDQLKEYLENTHGGNFVRAPLMDWIAKAREAGLPELIASYFESVVGKEDEINFPVLVKGFV